MTFLKHILLACACVVATSAAAQFYDTGQNPATIRWKSIKGEKTEIVFPSYFESAARRQSYYMDAVGNDISYGYSHGVMSVPVLLNTQNFVSNGISLLAPKRIEIVTVPPADTYSEPWLKQLAVHEYRHMAQYSNINRNFVRFAGRLLGQQAVLASTGVLPFWLLEGDATDAETQMSTYGRALQPSFTMHYRALGDAILDGRNPDKWFSGSLRQFVPDHYRLGYQLVTWANTHFDEFVWDRVAEYGSRNAFMLFTTPIALKKYYGLTPISLFRSAFGDLNAYWNSLPRRDDSFERLPVVAGSVYAEYSYPMFLNDTTLICFKKDFDRPSRIVAVDIATGREEVLAHTGNVNSRPCLTDDGVLYWTEWRESTFWAQRVNSQLCGLRLSAGRSAQSAGGVEKAEHVENVTGAGNVLFPVDDGRGGVACVKYDYNGTYSIVAGSSAFAFGEGVSLHGLARNPESGLYYCLTLGDEGMGIDEVDLTIGRSRTVKPRAHVTLSDLRCSAGKLCFGSIASGYDEVHMLDLTDRTEWRVSTSRYGSFNPSLSADGSWVAFTSYDLRGYLPVVESVRCIERVEYMKVPVNAVNPPRMKWNTVNIDTVNYTPAAGKTVEVKRYRKAAHLFDVHSWAPIDYSPDDVMDADFSAVRFGLTALSQNLLGTMISRLSYGTLFDGRSMAEMNVKYMGFAPKLEADVQWQNRSDGYLSSVRRFLDSHEGYYRLFDNGNYTLVQTDVPAAPARHNYMRFYGRVYLPVRLSSGYHTAVLTPSVEYNYRKLPVYDPVNAKYDDGIGTFNASLSYYNHVAMSKRDLQPRWGAALKVSVGANPFNSLSTTTLSVLGKLYLPGVALHHGVLLRANYQNFFGKGTYSAIFTDLYPRGIDSYRATVDYRAFSADYMMPLCYPDRGIRGLFTINRLSALVYADYARFTAFRQMGNIQQYPQLGRYTTSLHSLGGSLMIDFVPLRMPAAARTSLKLSVYFPSDTSSPVFGAGVSMPL